MRRRRVRHGERVFLWSGRGLDLGAVNCPPRATVDPQGFNPLAEYSYALHFDVFAVAMSVSYELLATVHESMMSRGLFRVKEPVRGAVSSGLLSGLVTISLGRTPTDWRGAHSTTGTLTCCRSAGTPTTPPNLRRMAWRERAAPWAYHVD